MSSKTGGLRALSGMVSQILYVLDLDTPLSAHWFLFVASTSVAAVFKMVMILLLLCLSALLATCEAAFFALTSSDLQNLSRQNKSAYAHLSALVRQPHRLRHTFTFFKSLLILAVMLFTYQFFQQTVSAGAVTGWEKKLVVFPAEQSSTWATAANLPPLITLLMALGTLLINEAVPKMYARRYKLPMVKYLAAPLHFAQKLLQPIYFVWMQFWERQGLRFKQGKKGTPIYDPELPPDGNADDKDPSESEADMLKSVVKFSDVTVRQVMTPRMEVIAVDVETTYNALLDAIRNSGYSRIPVYDDDLDYVKGILYVKDLLFHLNVEETFNWLPLVRTKVLYVPESKKISDLLREFQRKRLHMAIVVDEYGGSAGIVTLEDVLEEIIGDIQDEFDNEAEVQFTQLDEHTYVFEGKTLLTDVYRITGIEEGTFDEVRDEADSLAGLILAIYGQLPKKDTEMNYKNFQFKIVSASKRRIEEVLIHFEPRG